MGLRIVRAPQLGPDDIDPDILERLTAELGEFMNADYTVLEIDLAP
jgi:hypothetical protein